LEVPEVTADSQVGKVRRCMGRLGIGFEDECCLVTRFGGAEVEYDIFARVRSGVELSCVDA
jgi:hypothetical protein